MNRKETLRWVREELIEVMALHDLSVVSFSMKAGRCQVHAAATTLPTDGFEADVTNALGTVNLLVCANVYRGGYCRFYDETTPYKLAFNREGRTFGTDTFMKTVWLHTHNEAFVTNAVTGEKRLPSDIPAGHVIEELE